MIFVTVGTNEARFDRLLDAVADLDLEEEIVVQHGASRVRPANANCIDFLAFDELSVLVRGARAVVTHAGVGSIMVALANGKHPIVVPRLKRFREAVDDHQVVFGRRFAAAGLVTFVEDPRDLAAALRTAVPNCGAFDGTTDLAEDLRAYIQTRVDSHLSARRSRSG